MMTPRLPNLLIPGAAKSGTTSLYHYLAAHPECGMSDPKETYFFTKDYGSGQHDRYAQYFEHIDPAARIIGDGSPTYLSVPEAAERIRETLGPDVKLIFLLRNPVDRAISAYCHVRKHNADQRSLDTVLTPPTSALDEAIQWEQQSLSTAQTKALVNTTRYAPRHDDLEWNFRYLRNSTYLSDLRRFEQFFSRKNMHIILSEQLANDPVCCFAKLAAFLEITPDVLPENLGQRFNTTVFRRQSISARLIRALARQLPADSRWRRRLIDQTLHAAPTLSTVQRHRLTAIFEDHNCQLSAEFDVPTDRLWNVDQSLQADAA